MPLWEPKPEWQGQDAFLIGGGASIRNFDFSTLQGAHTIGINDAYILGPAVIEFCFFGDSGFFHRRKWDLEKSDIRCFTCAETLLNFTIPWCSFLKKIDAGLGEGNTVAMNWSSGAAAVNLARNLGAKRIFLLGYDMALVNGTSHWHGKQIRITEPHSFVRFDKGFKTLWTSLDPLIRSGDLTVYNVTDGSSKLNYFPRITFADMERMRSEPH